jgi:hypothetical protein
MTLFSNIYGVARTNIDASAQILEHTLNVTFEPHDSSFLGEYYLAYSEDQKERFELTANFNPIEEEWDFPALKEYTLILQISLSKRSVDRLQEVEKILDTISDMKMILIRKYEREDNDDDE